MSSIQRGWLVSLSAITVCIRAIVYQVRLGGERKDRAAGQTHRRRKAIANTVKEIGAIPATQSQWTERPNRGLIVALAANVRPTTTPAQNSAGPHPLGPTTIATVEEMRWSLVFLSIPGPHLSACPATQAGRHFIHVPKYIRCPWMRKGAESYLVEVDAPDGRLPG